MAGVRSNYAWLAGIACLFWVSTAQAVVLDFESWSHDDDQDVIQGRIYEQDGYKVFVSAAPPEGYHTYGLGHPSFAGSTAIHSNNSTHQNHLYTASGELFDVHSVKLVRGRFTNWAGGNVLFYGRFEDRSPSVTHVCSFPDGGTTLETCTFPPTFTGIHTLFWYNANPIVQLDDFDVSLTPPPPAVPSLGPGALSLLAGLLALAGARRARRGAPASA